MMGAPEKQKTCAFATKKKHGSFLALAAALGARGGR
jgi:hypothetical protein